MILTTDDGTRIAIGQLNFRLAESPNGDRTRRLRGRIKGLVGEAGPPWKVDDGGYGVRLVKAELQPSDIPTLEELNRAGVPPMSRDWGYRPCPCDCGEFTQTRSALFMRGHGGRLLGTFHRISMGRESLGFLSLTLRAAYEFWVGGATVSEAVTLAESGVEV